MSLKFSRGGRKIDQGMFSLRMIVSASNHLHHHGSTHLYVSEEGASCTYTIHSARLPIGFVNSAMMIDCR